MVGDSGDRLIELRAEFDDDGEKIFAVLEKLVTLSKLSGRKPFGILAKAGGDSGMDPYELLDEFEGLSEESEIDAYELRVELIELRKESREEFIASSL